MTTMQGSDSGWMLNFTKEIKDLNKPKLMYETSKYTIMGLITTNKDFSIFNFIVQRARYENILDNLNENITIFIPSDEELKKKYGQLFLTSIDYLSAKDIVMAHIVDKKITLEMLMNSDAHRLNTKHRYGRFKSIYTSYCNQKKSITVNESNLIEGNIMMQNGIIHIVDNFVFSPDCSNN